MPIEFFYGLGILVAAFVVYHILFHRKPVPVTPVAAPVVPVLPPVEVIKQCIRDENEKTRNTVTEVTGKVDALHKRWDKDDEKDKK